MRAPVLPQSPILWRARQQDPTTQPTSTLSQRRKQPGSAWFCSARRGDVSFWHCPPPLGPKPWHVGPTRILLVGLPQVPRPAQPGPCRGSCPSSLELSLRHVIWVEGGGLTSFKSKRRKHIHIQVRKRHLPLQLTQARSPPKLVALPPTSCYLSQIPHRLLLLGYWTLEPHAGRGERKGVLPTKPCPSPSSGESHFYLPSKQLLDSPGLFPGIWRRWCHLQTICFFGARGQASQIQVVCRSLLCFSCWKTKSLSRPSCARLYRHTPDLGNDSC